MGNCFHSQNSNHANISIHHQLWFQKPSPCWVLFIWGQHCRKKETGRSEFSNDVIQATSRPGLDAGKHSDAGMAQYLPPRTLEGQRPKVTAVAEGNPQ